MDFETYNSEDPIVASIIRKMYNRSQVGIKKYGTTMERNDLSFTDWVTHLQEECLDAAIYCERLKIEHEKLTKCTPTKQN